LEEVEVKFAYILLLTNADGLSKVIDKSFEHIAWLRILLLKENHASNKLAQFVCEDGAGLGPIHIACFKGYLGVRVSEDLNCKLGDVEV